jgi:hypothetical protein
MMVEAFLKTMLFIFSKRIQQTVFLTKSTKSLSFKGIQQSTIHKFFNDCPVNLKGVFGSCKE